MDAHLISETPSNLVEFKSGQKVARKFSPTDDRFWRDRVFQTKTTKAGQCYLSASYFVRIQFRGERRMFCLDTSDKAEAASKAKVLFFQLRSGGLLNADRSGNQSSPRNITVGAFLAKVHETVPLDPATMLTYSRKLRTLASSIAAETWPQKAAKYKSAPPYSLWRERVDKLPLSLLTTQSIKRWQTSFVRNRDTSPVHRTRAQHTADSIVRCCRALFSEEVIARTELDLPADALPFRSVKLLTKGLSSYRFKSTVNPLQLLAAARCELKPARPEQYKILLLAMGAGLRRMEIDRLLWTSVDAQRSQIHIEQHDCFRAKSAYSLAEISVEPELIAELSDLMKDGDLFVVSGQGAPTGRAIYHSYRTNDHCRKLCHWLRSKGVLTDKPIHTLRKLYGKLITEKFGIFAASKALRHSSVQITAAFYADDSRKIVPSLMGPSHQSATSQTPELPNRAT